MPQRMHIIQLMERQEEIIVVGYVMNDIIKIVVIHVHYVRHEISVHDERRHNVVVEHMQQHEQVVVRRQVHDIIQQHEHEVKQRVERENIVRHDHVVVVI